VLIVQEANKKINMDEHVNCSALNTIVVGVAQPLFECSTVL